MENLVKEYKSMKAMMGTVLLDDGRSKDNDDVLKAKIQHLEDGLTMWSSVEEEAHKSSSLLAGCAKLPEDVCKKANDNAAVVLNKLEAMVKGAKAEKDSTIKLFKELGLERA